MAVAEWKRSIEHVWCAWVWQYSHAQHRNELSRIRLSLIEQGSPRGKHVFVKWWRVWDKWVLIENLLTVQSLKWSDKIRWKEKNWLSLFGCSPLRLDVVPCGGTITHDPSLPTLVDGIYYCDIIDIITSMSQDQVSSKFHLTLFEEYW